MIGPNMSQYCCVTISLARSMSGFCSACELYVAGEVQEVQCDPASKKGERQGKYISHSIKEDRKTICKINSASHYSDQGGLNIYSAYDAGMPLVSAMAHDSRMSDTDGHQPPTAPCFSSRGCDEVTNSPNLHE